MEITATSSDLEALMVEWLNEINFVFETEHFAFGRFEIREISETRVSAVAFGEPLDPERHLVGEQVKAATYHNLSVTKMPSGKWAARVVLDI